MKHDEALSLIAAKNEKLEDILETLKPLCEVYVTPVKKYRYLKISGVVVYTFKSIEKFNLFKEWLDNDN